MTADELTLSSLSRSIIVLLMFGSMWGAGILGLLSCYFRYEFRKQKIQNFKTNKIVSSSRVRASSTDANSILTKYLDEVFPVVFQSQSYVTRMFTELLKHHRYFQLGTFRGEEADLRRVVTCCHLLTIQTMLMFLLGLCYELQVCFLLD